MGTSERSVWWWLAGGLALLVAGVVAGWGVLPAWSLGELGARQDYHGRFDELIRRGGLDVVSEDPRVHLVDRSRLPDPRAREGASAHRGEVLVQATGITGLNGGDRAELCLAFTPDGDARGFVWVPAEAAGYLAEMTVGGRAQEEAELLAGLLVPPERQLGDPVVITGLGEVVALFPLDGEPESHVEVFDPTGGGLSGFHRQGSLELAQKRLPGLSQRLLREIPGLLLFLGVVVLFMAFLGQRRIDLINGGWLGGVTLVVLLLESLPWSRGWLQGVEATVGAFGRALWVFLLWSVAESWLRSVRPDFSSSLDALRCGRLGPRGGRALLGGIGVGAAMAGAHLALLAAVRAFPGVERNGLSVPLPVFRFQGDPITDGLLLAAQVLLVVVLCLRFLPRRWALAAAVVAAALALQPEPLTPWPWAVVASLVPILALVVAFRHFELTGLLAAAVAFHLLPALVLSATLLDWMPGTFALTAGLAVAGLAGGVTGLRREAETEARGIRAPAFVRRLEDEKRLEHEMGLLARMQLGLLPEEVPRIDGWQISARSILATEVGGDLYDFLWDRKGRLWIAAGDVSGHGYSCAIVHAMTKAALASLVSIDCSPGEVLSEVDQVLRTVRSKRAFTSLALLCLDPATGRGRLANAGHPYPLVFRDGEVVELELPGLPLGQGPARRYGDLEVSLEWGTVLVFCSDGLFEATDRGVRAYGFDRPAQLLTKAARWPSNEIVEMLLADWRRHRGTVAAADDTTVVVIKRLLREEEETA